MSAMEKIVSTALHHLIQTLPPDTVANVKDVTTRIQEFDAKQQAIIQALGLIEQNNVKRHAEMKILLQTLIETIGRIPDAPPREHINGTEPKPV